MKTDLFVLEDSRRLARLSATPFASEDEMQRLLAEHPDLLGIGAADCS